MNLHIGGFGASTVASLSRLNNDDPPTSTPSFSVFMSSYIVSIVLNLIETTLKKSDVLHLKLGLLESLQLLMDVFGLLMGTIFKSHELSLGTFMCRLNISRACLTTSIHVTLSSPAVTSMDKFIIICFDGRKWMKC